MSFDRVSPTLVRRRSAAVASAAALAVAGLTFTAPAQAAVGSEIVTKANIAPDESVYAGWHEGSGNPGNFDVNSEGLQLTGRVQILKGYANNNSVLDSKNALLASTLDAASYDVVRGDVALQVPIFFTNDFTPNTAFTTLYPAAPSHTGENEVALTDLWVSTKQISATIEAGTAYPLGDIIAAIDDYKTLGFGVFTGPGQTATVSDITWGGTNYQFKPAALKAVSVKNADIDGAEGGDYSRWHQGYGKSQARHQVTKNGLVLAGPSQVLKGFADNSNNLATGRNLNLATQLQDAAYTVTSGTAFLQVPVFYNNGGGVKFATLRNAGATGAGTVALSDMWQVSKDLGTVDADTPTALGDIIAALGDYKAIGFGVLSSDDAVVKDLTFAGTKYTFTDAPAATKSVLVTDNKVAANESKYSGWHQGAVNGTTPGVDKVVDSGLQLTGRSQVINGYANNSNVLDAKNIRLEDAVRGASYTVRSGKVHFQIPIFFKDGAAVKFATLYQVAPATAGVNTINLTDQWISSKQLGSINANEPAPLADIIGSLKDYKVLAYGVYNEAGTSVVSDITWAGTKTTFSRAASKVKASVTSKKFTSKKKASINVVVTAPGAVVDGVKVKVKKGSKTIGSGTVKNGKVKISVGKLKKGTNTLKIAYPGTASAKPGSATLKVKIKK